jgi:hypothetical protein
MDHGHEHGHDHHHGHAHDHPHHHHEHGHDHGIGDYYLEQLLTIFICAAFGVVAILMYRFRMLNIVLVDVFHPWVLGGGIVLLVLAAVRGVALWSAAGAHAHAHHHEHGPDCDHGHEHGPECDHAHGHDSPGVHHHDHAPGDDHSHGNIFWRVVVLAFPLLLFCLGLPNKGFSKDWLDRRLGKDTEIGEVAAVEAKGGDALTFSFDELNASTTDPGKRQAYEGRTVRVKGQLRSSGSGKYTLFKMKMTCCAADTIPLKAVIKAGFVSQLPDDAWVTAEGVLQYVELPDKKQFLPVIRVKDASGLQKATPE